MIGIIVAINKDGIIGVNGKIPWNNPKDLQRFKKITTNKTVIMGRKTWESLGYKKLPNRRNIVITSKVLEDVEHYTSVHAALEVLMKEDALTKIWFIGGHDIYEEGLKHASTIELTHVPDEVNVSGTDDVVYFPDFNREQWSLVHADRIGGTQTIIHETLRRVA